MTKFCYTKFLFVYVLLFHFVSSEEKFFIKYEETKFEFTLDENTQGGELIKQIIEDNNNNVEMKVYDKYFESENTNIFPDCAEEDEYDITTPEIDIEGGGLNPGFSAPGSSSKTFLSGSIISSSCHFRILKSDSAIEDNEYEQIGQLTQPNDFINSLSNYNNDDTFNLQFILENEAEKIGNPEKSTTVKTKKKTKIKKKIRTKILKRTIKMKPVGFWKNIGYKILKTLKSLLI